MGLSIGYLKVLTTWQLVIGERKRQEQKVREKLRESNTQDGNHSLFITPSWKWHILTSIILFYSLEANQWIQPTLKGKGLHKWVNTKKQGSLEAILKATYHIAVAFSVPKVGLHVWASQVHLKGHYRLETSLRDKQVLWQMRILQNFWLIRCLHWLLFSMAADVEIEGLDSSSNYVLIFQYFLQADFLTKSLMTS